MSPTRNTGSRVGLGNQHAPCCGVFLRGVAWGKRGHESDMSRAGESLLGQSETLRRNACACCQVRVSGQAVGPRRHLLAGSGADGAADLGREGPFA
eukprot:1930710-Alexandrium_andersonii.AAC.1